MSRRYGVGASDHGKRSLRLCLASLLPPASVVQHDARGDRSFSFYRTSGLSADIDIHIDELAGIPWNEFEIFHFGSVSLSDQPSRDATLWAVKQAQQAGSVISFDPNIRLSLWNHPRDALEQIRIALPLSAVLKVSEEEMRMITETDDYRVATRMIFDRYGIPIIIVTRASRGSYALCNGIETESPAYLVPTIDTTGSGDCFLATFLYAMMQRNALHSTDEEVLRHLFAFANAAGSLATTREGAISSIPSEEEITQCMLETPCA